MLPGNISPQVRRLQLRARRAVADPLGGAYRSVFKGVGIAFEEVRAYQPGDDIRSIDWNVTARMGQPFIKRYVEERELTVVFLLDGSASMSFGTLNQAKHDVVAEIGALLALCAISNNDRVGLIVCTDKVEKFIPPRKTSRHALRLIRDLFVHRPNHAATQLRVGLNFLNHVLRRRALVFVLSDFLDTDYEQVLRRTGRRHDVVAVAVHDPREESLPNVGLLRIQDFETGQQRLIDTADGRFQAEFLAGRQQRAEAFRNLSRAGEIDVLDVSTEGDHLDTLVGFFHRRARRLTHHP